MKNLCILGSTGSIGTQALEVVRARKDKYRVTAIAACTNVDLLYSQAVEFKPEFIAVYDKNSAKILKEKLRGYNIKILDGMEGLVYISTLDSVDVVIVSVVGMIGLKPTVEAIRAGKTIALANKETLVTGGDIVKRELRQSKAKIIPVDSEHCAIYQCLLGEDSKSIKRLILTASGGPFRGLKRDQMTDIKPEQALKHPKWNMGRKISIDSATLMNKGLEVIEAHFLFDAGYDDISVVVHPQSIIHSMVEFIDGSIIAQLSNTDMRHPIQFALDYPERCNSSVGYLDLIKHNKLTFEEPDENNFECLKLGFEAGRTGGTMTTVLNAANEEAVKLFLDNKIKFLDIPELIREAMKNHKAEYDFDIEKILEIEITTRNFVNLLVK